MHDSIPQGELDTDIVDECAIPNYKGPAEFDIPECAVLQLESIVKEFKVIFRATTGKTSTSDAYHYIHTSGNPVRVSPRRVPACCRIEVMQQLETILDLDTHVKNPWMVPAVFVFKKSGQLRICVDYRELNKCITKDFICYHYRMKCKTDSPGPLYSLRLICTVGTGNCQ